MEEGTDGSREEMAAWSVATSANAEEKAKILNAFSKGLRDRVFRKSALQTDLFQISVFLDKNAEMVILELAAAIILKETEF